MKYIFLIAALGRIGQRQGSEKIILRFRDFPNVTYAPALVAPSLSRQGKDWFEQWPEPEVEVQWLVYNSTMEVVALITKMRKLFLTAVTAITCLGLITPSLAAKDTAKNAPVTLNIEKTIKSSYGYRKDNHCFIFAKNFAEKLHKKHGIPSKIVTFFFAAWPETGHVYVTYELNGERWAIDNEMAAPVKVTGKTPADWSAQLQDLPKKSILMDLVIEVPNKSKKEKQYLDGFYKYMLYDLKHNPIWKWSEDEENLKKNPMQKIFRSISRLFGKN